MHKQRGTQDHLLKQMQPTFDTNAKATQDHLITQLRTSLTLIDGKTQQRFTRSVRLEHVTPKEEEEDADRSARAPATAFPTDTSAEKIKTFTQKVIQKEAADPASHAYLTLRTRSERNNLMKTLRRSQHVVVGGSRPPRPLVGGTMYPHVNKDKEEKNMVV